VTNGDKENFVGLNLVSVKDVQVGLQRQWHGQKNQAKGGKSGIRHALKLGCNIRSENSCKEKVY
jgi:hypothetical protein